MKYRKLRIAWSVAWGVACLLLVVFWVRSATIWDSPYGPLGPGRDFQLNSIKGHLFFSVGKPSSANVAAWKWRTYRVTSLTRTGATGSVDWPFTWTFGGLGIGVVRTKLQHHVVMPYWLLVALSLALVAVPWQRWRFSLRTLLIAMTVAAIGLGWIVYALRK